MKRALILVVIIIVATSFVNETSAQKKKKEDKKGYEFTVTKINPVTPVKDQYRSGTCWSFASISYLEAELLRRGKGEYDLSEMFVVRNSYSYKADKYVRMHGKTNFSAGGLAHDVFWVLDNYGIVPETAYDGLVIGEDGHIHGEMDAVFTGYLNELIKNRNRKLTPVWKDGFNGLLNAYLGEYPKEFSYNGSSYTPESFAKELDINSNEYVMIGSFTHHPFYESFIIEIPDNWIWGEIANVPMDEMMQVLDNALENGYTVCWDADVSEKGFDWKKGVSLVPSEEIEDLDGLERARWDELSQTEKNDLIYDFSSPKKEKVITQEMRQESFDNYVTTDDHLMHITGSAVDQDGKPFYLVKNSWGTENHIYDGYFYSSKAFMEYKTIFFVVHKDAVPVEIAEKLGL